MKKLKRNEDLRHFAGKNMIVWKEEFLVVKNRNLMVEIYKLPSDPDSRTQGRLNLFQTIGYGHVVSH